MSSWAKSKFYRAGSEVKPRSDSDEGISERVRVAYQGKCNILLTSHQDSLRDPAAATPCASASLLAQQKFDSAQDDRLIVCFVVIVRNDEWSMPSLRWKHIKSPARGGALSLIYCFNFYNNIHTVFAVIRYVNILSFGFNNRVFFHAWECRIRWSFP